MKNLSLRSIPALLGLCIIPACVLSVTDDVADTADEVTTDDTTTTDDDTTTTDTDDDVDTTADDVDTTADDVDTTADDVDTTADDVDTTADETTDGGPACGWNGGGQPPGYYCGFEGEDPDGLPIACPDGLVEGDSCAVTGLTGEGCCDADGNNWYCGDPDMVVFEACA